MHPNNLHQKPYDFKELVKKTQILTSYIITNSYGEDTIDFANPEAVYALNKALLATHYGIEAWDIPSGYLCPPIPGRADYIHHLADLFKKEANQIKGLDIGVGANCIYPILGNCIYGWQMVGCDSDAMAVKTAQNIIQKHPKLQQAIQIRHQGNKSNIFDGIIQPEEYFDFTMCNPPFHTSKEAALKGTQRKLNNLKIASNEVLNFGGQPNELWCNGGEALFLKRMIKQSRAYAKQVGVFTSLVSKKETLPTIEKQLHKLGALYQIITMEQGNKKSRFITWNFQK
ncbi:23S rRNA (adenine(1618)-N(6))-methyltransferase RlmF [Aquimarina sp. W85]|uniref:23S rRNA (adenine(1618)-N(6))-methyltransferase RlmF n=1 Tax=Aquimarina rhodophyticola TaxID=3342246 RepID=UPI00367068EC